MVKIQKEIEKFLNEEEVLEIAKSTQFIKREGGKIDPVNFVKSFFILKRNKEQISIKNWATSFSCLTEEEISKQGLGEKYYGRHLDFIKSLLSRRLFTHITPLVKEKANLFSDFEGVYVRDSVCIKLHPSLWEEFPSANSRGKPAATARIQAGYELKSRRYAYFDLGSYRDTDGKKASSIFSYANAGDLVIEDLGYQSFDNYIALKEAGIYLVTRYKFNTIVMDVETEQRIDFLKLLEEKGEIDEWFLIGATHKVKVRIVAKRITKKQAEKRKKRARKNRHSKAKHSKEYYKMLEWDIVVTTVPKAIWDAGQVLDAYRIRWHIEIIFKAWKSNLKIDKMSAYKMSGNRCKMMIYLALLYVLFCAQVFRAVYKQIKETDAQKHPSLLAFYRFFSVLIQMEKDGKSPEFIFKMLLKNVCYQRRKDRQNYEQLVFY